MLVAGVLFYLYSFGSVSLTVYPTDAKYELNGTSYIGDSGSVRIKTGTETIKVSRNGFKDAGQDIKVVGDKTSNYTIILEPTSGVPGFSNLSNEEKINTVLQYQADYDGKKFKQSFPLESYLPYSESNFTIDYMVSGETDYNPKLIINLYSSNGVTTDQAKKLAQDWVRSKGFDIQKFAVTYTYGSNYAE